MLKTFLSITAVISICGLSAFTQSPRGLLPTDLSTIKDISDAQISPDGSRVVYVVSEATPDRTRTISRLWIVPAAGGESKRLTTGNESESTPRWSPDGKLIAFYSNRDGRDGLWVVAAGGGEPKLLTHVAWTNFYLKGAGESLVWSPDNKQIAFLSSPEILSEGPTTPGPTDQKLAGLPPQALRPLTREDIDKLPVEVREMILRAHSQAMGKTLPSPLESALSLLPDDPKVIKRIQYKSRTSFSDNLQSQIFIADVEKRQLRQVTSGQYYSHSINWSPKSDEIVFVSNHEPDPDRLNNTDLFTVNVNTLAIRQLTKTKGCEWQPVFSPSGNEVAYLATKREITTIDSVAEDAHAYVIPAQGGEARELGPGIDRRVSIVKWRKNGEVVFSVNDSGRTKIYGTTTNGSANGKARLLIDHESLISNFAFFRKRNSEYLLRVFTDPTHTAEVYVDSFSVDGEFNKGEAKPLSLVNQPVMRAIQLSKPRVFTFENEGLKVEGWLIPPLNIDEKKKYPVILSIQGGPHGMYGYSFNSTFQAMAAHGYAVLLINPRGSSGYGQKYSDGCVNDWGGGDYRDLMKGVDEALTRFPFLDKDRMGVTGGSYGGYMTNWVITQTDRFKAAVASASLSNLISFYSTSLYQDLIHAEFNGYPWDNYELLWDRSPLKHIKKVKTPLLLLHGEQDNDVHITQAEEMYTALRVRGIESVFVRYPREGHGLREPRHREDSLARTLQWFDRYLKQ